MCAFNILWKYKRNFLILASNTKLYSLVEKRRKISFTDPVDTKITWNITPSELPKQIQITQFKTCSEAKFNVSCTIVSSAVRSFNDQRCLTLF